MIFWKVALRNIRRQKGYSLTNVAGLALGIACSILVFLFVGHELSYDRYHDKADRLYRLGVTASIGGTDINQTYSSAEVFRKLFDEFPEIETGVKIMRLGKRAVRADQKSLFESKLFAVDSTFFDVFSAPLVHGEAARALVEPNNLVVSEHAALRYFGRTDVLGETVSIQFDEPLLFEITGVVENVPDNSHFHYDFLFSLATFSDAVSTTGWTDNRFQSYVLFRDKLTESKMQSIGERLKDLDRKYNDRSSSYEDWLAQGNYWEFFLQSITSIHLESDLSGEFEANGDRAYVFMALAIGAIVLLIACVNFTNLSTARASLRIREVSIRKIIGSDRKRLVLQFLGESVLLSLVALALGLAIVELCLPSFEGLVERRLEIHYLSNFAVIPSLLAFGLVVGLVAGAYPALVLSSYRPAMILGQRSIGTRNTVWLRNALIVFQFAATIFLMISAVTVDQQLAFLQNKDVGFDREQILLVDNTDLLQDDIDTFKEILGNHSDIVSVSGASAVPGQRFPNYGFRVPGSDFGTTLNTFICDHNYLETLKLQMAEGRFFSREFGSDASGIILNEAACELLGWDDWSGKQLRDCWNYGTYTVIGVVKDLHYESLHQEIRPMAFLNSSGPFRQPESVVAVRLGVENATEIVAFVEDTWQRFVPSMPFSYSFLDADYDNLYVAEEQARKLSTLLCTLAIFISCIGLLGLAAFVADQRYREIGLRRVLGATVPNIVNQLNSGFLRWVLVSNLIAWPVAWFLMDRWLENFAYRIDPDWRVFAGSGAAAVLIALVTVSYQSIRAALANPVDALRR